MECALLNDKRQILRLRWDYPDTEDMFTVGEAGVTSIVVVPVHGQGDYVPWFEVVQNGKVSRWNGAQVSGIDYEGTEPPGIP